MEELTTSHLLDLTQSIAAPLFSGVRYPWQVLDGLAEFIITLGSSLPADEFEQRGENVWVARDAKVAPSAYIGAICIIDHGAEVRHCAYIRGAAIVGAGAVVGNSAELKNCVLFNGAQVPHFNYVGDSLLGYRSHLGAGALTSNVKSDKSNVSIRFGRELIETGRRKLGAIVGDYVEVGCNAVLCPGSVIGRRSTIYPLSRVRGYVADNSIYKADGVIIKKNER